MIHKKGMKLVLTLGFVAVALVLFSCQSWAKIRMVTVMNITVVTAMTITLLLTLLRLKFVAMVLMKIVTAPTKRVQHALIPTLMDFSQRTTVERRLTVTMIMPRFIQGQRRCAETVSMRTATAST